MTSLAPFVCEGCGAPVPVPDAESIACPSCGRSCHVPEVHRRASSLVASEDTAIRSAEAAWAQFERTRISPWVPLLAGVAPSITFAAGFLGCALRATFGALERRTVGYAMFAPIVPLYLVYAIVAALAEPQKHVAVTRASLAARSGAVPACRRCGASLSVMPGRAIVRCIYCRTENLITVSQDDERALEGSRREATESIAAALEAVATRVRRARLGLVVVAGVFGAFTAMPLAWAFSADSWCESSTAFMACAAWFPFFFLLLLPLALAESWGSELRSARNRPPFANVVERGMWACLAGSIVLSILLYVLAVRTGGHSSIDRDDRSETGPAVIGVRATGRGDAAYLRTNLVRKRRAVPRRECCGEAHSQFRDDISDDLPVSVERHHVVSVEVALVEALMDRGPGAMGVDRNAHRELGPRECHGYRAPASPCTPPRCTARNVGSNTSARA